MYSTPTKLLFPFSLHFFPLTVAFEAFEMSGSINKMGYGGPWEDGGTLRIAP